MRLIDADKLIELTRKDMKYALITGFLIWLLKENT